MALILFSQTGLAGLLVDAVIALALDPGPDGGGWPRFLAQKTYHVMLFGGLGALLALRRPKPSRLEIAGWLIGFSTTAEILQLFWPNRNANLWDASLNIAAAVGFYAIFSAREGARGFRPES